MPVIIALIIAFLVALVLRLRGRSVLVAWLIAFCVIPLFVVLDEFVIPYRGGGASMWPIALIVGGTYGAAAGGLGTLVASIYLKLRRNSCGPA